ncbi:inverted formin-2 [Anaeramoeba flamelloides]|uniref:Inverted formin-2 n=1 Tax=Anaeramoeba flamelloides TaxID=1746091 RepID=A0ABQ8YCH0_9EUKA|nr:inverted formin-2 [Anaeramoeba flamelloides]
MSKRRNKKKQKKKSKKRITKPWGRLNSLNFEHPNAELINQQEMLGRNSKCVVQFASMEISNIHTRIWLQPPKPDSNNLTNSKPVVYIQDVSTNGTYLNGKIIGKNKTQKLRDGDQVTLVNPKYDENTIAYLFEDYSGDMFKQSIKKKKKEMKSREKVPSTFQGERAIVQTPQGFVDQLRYNLIPNILSSLYKVIQLQTRSWITTFFELGGFDLLIEGLRFRTEKSRRNQTDRSVELLVVQCLKLLMDKTIGLETIINHPKAIETLVLSLYNDNTPAKCNTLKLLTVPLVVGQESYDKVLDGFSTAVDYGYERIRFRRLVGTFEKVDDLKYRQRLMLLINYIIVTPDNVMVRTQMRREFLSCDLEKCFDDILYPLEDIKITRQLRFFLNEKEKDEEIVKLGKIDVTDPMSLTQAILQQTQGSDEYQYLLGILQGLFTIQNSEKPKEKWSMAKTLIQKSILNGESTEGEDQDETNKDNNEESINIEIERQKNHNLEDSIEKLNKKIANLEKMNQNLLKGIKNDNEESKNLEGESDDFSRFSQDLTKNTLIGKKSSILTKEKEGDKKIENTGSIPPPPNFGGGGGGSTPPPPKLGGGGMPPPPNFGGGSTPPPPKLGGGGMPPPPNFGGGGMPPPPNFGGGGGMPPPPNFGGGGMPPPPNFGGGGGMPPPPNFGGGGGMPPPPNFGGGGGGGMPPPPNFGGGGGLLAKKRRPNVKMKQLFWKKVNQRNMADTIWQDVATFISEKNLAPNIKVLEDRFCKQKKLSSKEQKVIEEEKKQREEEKKPDKIKFIDGQKSQTVEMMITRWKLSHQEIKDAILKMDSEVFNLDKLKTLVKIMPEETELESVTSYQGDPELLGEVEKFYLVLSTVPNLLQRLAAFEFKLEFNIALGDILLDVDQVYNASNAIIGCEGLKQILALALVSGNYMNLGSNRGNATGFQMDFISKLSSTKSIDGKITLIQYCIIEAENQKLEKVLKIPEELFSLRQVIGKPIDAIQAESNKLKKRIQQNQEFLKSFKKNKGIFYKSLFTFLKTTGKKMQDLDIKMKKMTESYDKAVQMLGMANNSSLTSVEFFSMVHNFVLDIEKSIKDNAKEKELEEKKKKDEKRKLAQTLRAQEQKKKKQEENLKNLEKQPINNQNIKIGLPEKKKFKNIYGNIKSGKLIRKDSKQDMNLLKLMQQAQMEKNSLRKVKKTVKKKKKKNTKRKK